MSQQQTELEIAVIGMAGRFPGAKNVNELWRNLCEGVESIQFFTDRELEDEGVSPSTLADPRYVKARGTLADAELFDASFFGFSPREAEIMDPQQRLFLECCWEALESAGYDPDTYPRSIGTYAGSSISSYLLNLYSNSHLLRSVSSMQLIIGNDKDHLPTRVSYKLNLKGPSVNIQSGCSTSLVAVHIACQSLLNGDCDLALAGGVSIDFPQKAGYFYQEGGIESPDGHTRAFDAKAQGTVGGSGVGVVVLKRLDEAIADADFIYAVIKGSAINNDGLHKVGYTAPSEDGQAQVIRAAQLLARVHPDSISYIEAHGTGTALGDPIEVAALTRAFSSETDRKGFCAIGSLKTNVGHLNAAAGVGGLIKTALALHHKLIPPSLNFEQDNPRIDFVNSPFFVNRKLRQWQEGTTPRRAGVSSFGIGGTNAHVILEEAPPRTLLTRPARPCYLLPLSAKTPIALEQMSVNLANHLRENPQLDLAAIAYTLHTGRRAFIHRHALVCRSLNEAVEGLSCPSEVSVRGQTAAQPPTVVFMFPGQGTQYVDMGRQIYEIHSRFRREVDSCAEMLREELELDLREVLYPIDERAREEAEEKLSQTRIAQPALFVIEYALAQLWMSLGVRPQAMIGHSLGEYVAACLAGVLSLEDALWLVARRGKLTGQLREGAMLAVPLGEEELMHWLNPSLTLAAVNAASLSVVSGPMAAIEGLARQLSAAEHQCRRLRIEHAFHSAMVEPAMEPLIEAVKQIELKPPQMPYVSNVTGLWMTNQDAIDPSYWARHMRGTVRFAEGLRQVCSGDRVILLEVGPSNSLSRVARQELVQQRGVTTLQTLPHPREPRGAEECMQQALARLWVAGIDVDWSAGWESGHRIPLPGYAFERQRYWAGAFRGVDGRDRRPEGRRDAQVRFYAPTWKLSAWQGPGKKAARLSKKNWMVIRDEGNLWEEVERQLAAAGAEVVSISSRSDYEKEAELSYRIKLDQVDDYVRVLKELDARSWRPEVIVHLPVSSPAAGNEVGGESGLNHILATGFGSLSGLIGGMEAIGSRVRTQIVVVTSEMEDILEGEPVVPEKATVLGPCLTLGQKPLSMKSRSIDLDSVRKEGGLRDEQVERLIAEADMEWEESWARIAYRGSQRWEIRYEAVTLGAEKPEKKAVAKEDGVYLVIGGELGRLFAEQLGRTARAKAVFLEQSVGVTARQEHQCLMAGARPKKKIEFDIRQEDDLISEMEEGITERLRIKDICRYDEFESTSNRLCASYILDYFSLNKIDLARGHVWSKDELRRRLRILPKFEKFYDFMVRTLEEERIVKSQNGTIEFIKEREPSECTKAIRESIDRLYPNFAGRLDLLDHCVNNYGQALSGDIEAISVLYPDGTSAYLDEQLKGSICYSNVEVYLILLRELISKLLKDARGQRLRILEVGGGGGELTKVIIPTIVGKNVEYHFTDLGKSFIAKAEKQAARYGLNFMKFGVFDISQDPRRQGYESHTFDLVVAFNVVHATKSIRETISNLKKLISPGGLLCLVEVVRVSRWATMVWGLAEGWWYFEDNGLRKETPLLKLEQWEELLVEEGFETVRAYPRARERRLESDHGLIIARQPDELENDERLACPRMETALSSDITTREIDRLGCEVVHCEVNLSDREALREVIGQAQEKFGVIKGAIHIPSSEIGYCVKGASPEELQDRLRSAIKGMQTLDEMLRSLDLDFFIHISTSKSDSWQANESGLCAESAFLEAYCRSRALTTPGRTVTTHWAGCDSQEIAAGGAVFDSYLEAYDRILTAKDLTQIIFRPEQIVLSNASPDRLNNASSSPEVPDGGREVDATHLVGSAYARPALGYGYVAARNEIERRLAGIWQELLGINQVGVYDDFFELGGESLLALQLVSKISKLFNVEVPLNIVLDASNIARLSELINERVSQRDPSHSGAELKLPSVIVEIQRGRSKYPFYFIHPTGGGLFDYRELAHCLGPEQSVYGVQPRGLDGKDEPFNRIEDMAAYYLEAARAVQPEGPYLIGGASFGGAVAFELAQQLRAQGQKVALLVLFDTPGHEQLPQEPIYDSAVLRSLVGNKVILPQERLRGLTIDEQLSYALEQGKKTGNIPVGIDLEIARRIVLVWKSNAEALFSYRPQRYPGRLVFFRARERDPWLPEYPELPWIELAEEGAEIHVTPGGHDTMLNQPYVQMLAKRLVRCLSEAQSK
jgi:acyl transferase domain-containing protein/thioesterase domain-containing protein/SAM-dependent methyltransferase/acyl carrier protein